MYPDLITHFLPKQINMQSLIRDSVLRHLRVTVSRRQLILGKDVSATSGLHRQFCTTTTGLSHDQITARVIGLVSKFDKIDASKVLLVLHINVNKLCCCLVTPSYPFKQVIPH